MLYSQYNFQSCPSSWQMQAIGRYCVGTWGTFITVCSDRQPSRPCHPVSDGTFSTRGPSFTRPQTLSPEGRILPRYLSAPRVPSNNFSGLVRSISIILIKCMKVQPSLKFLVKNNVQLENNAQTLVLNFIITLLASTIQTFTFPFVAGPSPLGYYQISGTQVLVSFGFLSVGCQLSGSKCVLAHSVFPRSLLALVTKRGAGAPEVQSVSEYPDSPLQGGVTSQLKVPAETHSLCKQRLCSGPQLAWP